MTLDEFVALHDGKFLEVAGSANAKNQCVDLANGYVRDVLHLPIIEWTNAVDFPKKAGNAYEYILNTPTGVPSKGDLVIFAGDVGHISIFLEGTAKDFFSFDQNYPTGSPCHKQKHTYSNPKVLGWLHPKVQPTPPQDQQMVINELRADRDKNWQLYQQEQKAKIDLEDALNAKNKTIDGLTRELEQKKKELQVATETISGHLVSIQGLTDQLQEKNKEVAQLYADLEKATLDLEILKAQRKDLSKYETKELVTEVLNRIFRKG